MTNFKQVQSNGRRGENMKDGRRPDRRPTKKQRQATEDQWFAAGFEYRWIRNAPRLTYTWSGDFPVFEVIPGIIGISAGLIARYAPIEIFFPYETDPADIAARLNDEILAIMRHDAEIADQPLVDDGDDWIYF